MAKIIKGENGKAFMEVKLLKPLERIMAALFIGTDQYPQAYCLVGGEILNKKNKIVNGKPEDVADPEIHFYAEFFSRVDETFNTRLKAFLKDNMVLRALLPSNNEKLAKNIIKECVTMSGRVIPFTARDDCSVVIQRAFSRQRTDGSPYLNMHGDCGELKSLNYYPVRHCATVLLEFYDKPAYTKVYKSTTGRIKYGY